MSLAIEALLAVARGSLSLNDVCWENKAGLQPTFTAILAKYYFNRGIAEVNQSNVIGRRGMSEATATLCQRSEMPACA